LPLQHGHTPAHRQQRGATQATFSRLFAGTQGEIAAPLARIAIPDRFYTGKRRRDLAGRLQMCVGRITQFISDLPEGSSPESIGRNLSIVMPALCRASKYLRHFRK